MDRAYVEVLEFLKYIPLDEYDKIPKKVISFFEENKDKDYEYKYSENKVLSKKANAIIIKLYLDYFSTYIEREKIMDILCLNSKMVQSEDNNIEKIFSERSKNNENVFLPQELKNDNYFRKILDKIKEFFIKK